MYDNAFSGSPYSPPRLVPIVYMRHYNKPKLMMLKIWVVPGSHMSQGACLSEFLLYIGTYVQSVPINMTVTPPSKTLRYIRKSGGT